MAKISLSKCAIVALATTITLHAADADIGTISVESSTIDDKFETKKTEVSSTSTISGEKVDEAHVENVQQILQSIPGITTEVQSGDSIKIHIRGIENQMYMGEKPGVAVVIDGVPVFERTGRVNIDLDNIESIKVIKGGASYLFGDDALSGAVIITTKRGAKYNNNFGTVEFGSYGYQKLLARTGISEENYNFHIQASERKADGYHEDSAYSAQYLNGKLQYYLDDTSDVTFGMEYSDREKDSHGTVGGVTQAETNPESIYDGDMDSRDYTRKYDVELLKLFLTYSKDFSNNSNLLVNTYMYTDDTNYWSAPQSYDASGGTVFTDDDYTKDNYYTQVQTGIKSEYRTSSDKFATLLGIDLRDNNYKNKVLNLTTYKTSKFSTTIYNEGDENSNDETDENVYAIYGEYKQALTKDLTGTANLRYDVIKQNYVDNLDSSDNGDSKFRIYSYRLGLNYDLSENNILFTNYSTGFRAPTISQLYGGSCSTYSCTEANQDLKPEESKNYEIGIRGNTKSLSYEAAIFRIDRKDFIMKTSGNYGESSSTNSDMYDNIGGARHQGAELALNQNLTDNFSYNFAYTYLDAKYTNYNNLAMDLGGTYTTYDVTGNEIPRTSKHTVNVILDYLPTSKLKISTEWNKKSAYYADDLNKLKIRGQESININASYNTKLSDYELSFFARVDNIFDNQYYNTARASSDRDENGVFDMEDLSITVNQGRTYTAGLSVKF